jgi:hypothetical protein
MMRKNSLSDVQHLTQEALDYPDDYQLGQADADYLLALSEEEADALQFALSVAMIRLEQENDEETLHDVNNIFWRVKYDGLIDV